METAKATARKNKMTQVSHIATITAYEAKDGTFSTAVRNETTKEITRAYGFPTLAKAEYEVKIMAWNAFGAVHYAKVNRKGEYLANVWVQ
jgi:hypothetical protein